MTEHTPEQTAQTSAEETTAAEATAPGTVLVHIPMNAVDKEEADALFAEFGFDLPTAVNIFIKQALREWSIPFQITIPKPNKETIAAMLEAERVAHDPDVKHYTDLDELFEDLGA